MEKNKIVTAMVERPKGSGLKFDFDETEGRFRLNKILPAGLVFPFDFGMIPGAKGEDGDPLDIIIIAEEKTFPGCLIDCRIIGVLEAEQTERDGRTVRNDRFVGIPEVSQLFLGIRELAQPESILNQVEHFFKNYNEQAGKIFRMIARQDAATAQRLLTAP